MTKYAKIVDGKIIKFFKNPLVVGYKSIYNPTVKVLLENGWKEYKEDELDSNKSSYYDYSYIWDEQEKVITKSFEYTDNLDKAKSTKLTEICNKYKLILDNNEDELSAIDISSFYQQVSEAKAYLESKDTNDAPLLSLIAEDKGVQLDELAQSIVDNLTKVTTLYSNLLKQKLDLKVQLEKATTTEDVIAISVEYKITD